MEDRTILLPTPFFIILFLHFSSPPQTTKPWNLVLIAHILANRFANICQKLPFARRCFNNITNPNVPQQRQCHPPQKRLQCLAPILISLAMKAVAQSSRTETRKWQMTLYLMVLRSVMWQVTVQTFLCQRNPLMASPLISIVKQT